MNNLPQVTDRSEVKSRIEARQTAEQIAALADEEAKTYGNVLWEQLHKICCAHTRCKVDEERVERQRRKEMTREESKRFGRELVPFHGEFFGKRVDDVPLPRLQWYADQRFVDELRRYLASKRVLGEEP